MNERHISELEKFFGGITISDEPIRLDVCTVIESPKVFIDAHLQHLKANMGKENSKPYFYRLLQLKQIIEDGANKET